MLMVMSSGLRLALPPVSGQLNLEELTLTIRTEQRGRGLDQTTTMSTTGCIQRFHNKEVLTVRKFVTALLVAFVGLSVLGCRKSTEEQVPPPGAVKEPPQMQIQAPAPGGARGGEGMQMPVRRPPK